MIFKEGMSMEEKKATLEQNANVHNMLVSLPGGTAITGASSFSVAKQLVAQGEVALAAYYLSLCEDPVGDMVNKEMEDDMP